MNKNLVLQTDFGLQDGAVSAMYGVAYTVAPEIRVSDLTHGIEPYNIFEGSYRLAQAVPYWPAGTVFVSVVDPGVGSNRKSVIAKLKSGHYIVTPDNGSLTHLDLHIGIESVKEIDEGTNRLPHSQDSHTFHGRDVYVYNGAMLAADEAYYDTLAVDIDPADIERIELSQAKIDEEGVVHGVIDILDIRFGSLWTNIPITMLKEAGISHGDKLEIIIRHKGIKQYHNHVPFGKSFAEVPVGEVVAYVNSLLQFAVAINQNNFSEVYGVGTGRDWTIEVRKI